METSPVIYGREDVLASYERSRLLGVFAHAYRIQPAFARRVLKLYDGPIEIMASVRTAASVTNPESALTGEVLIRPSPVLVPKL